jgi:hypothetical protein
MLPAAWRLPGCAGSAGLLLSQPPACCHTGSAWLHAGEALCVAASLHAGRGSAAVNCDLLTCACWTTAARI